MQGWRLTGDGMFLNQAAFPYLSGLLAGRLVLGSLTQVFDPLAFGQEVLLLGHFLAFDNLVEQLPVKAHEDTRVLFN